MTLNRKIQIAALAVFVNAVGALTLTTQAQNCTECDAQGNCWLCVPPGDTCFLPQVWTGSCSDATAKQQACNALGKTLPSGNCCSLPHWGPGLCSPLPGGQFKVFCSFMAGYKMMGGGGGNHKK